MHRLISIMEKALWIAAGVAILMACRGLPMGYDVWFHLLNGQEILTSGVIPHEDHWLVPFPGIPPRFFPNYEWLFGVLLRLAWQWGGYTAADLLQGLIIAATFTATALACRRKAADEPVARLLAPAILLLAFAAASPRFEPRPQIVSAAGLALLALFLRTPGIVRTILFIPVAFFWANCHIEILLGIGYAGIWLLPEHSPGPDAGHAAGGRGKFRAVLLALLVLAVALSPSGPHLLAQAGSYYDGERMIRSMGFWNVELVPIRFDPVHSAGSQLLLLAALGILLRIFRRKTVLDPETVGACAFLVLPFISLRYLLPSAVILAPFIAGIPAEFYPARPAGPGLEEKPTPVPLICAALALPLVLWAYAPVYVHPAPSRPAAAGCSAPPDVYDSGSEFPDAALRFLGRNNIEGNIFSHDRWGNFIAFYDNPCPHTGSPTRRTPYMNAMFQTMPRQRVERYLKAILDDAAWRILCRDAAIRVALVPYPENASDPWWPFMQRIASDSCWRLIWWDDAAFVYVASGQEYLARGGKSFSAARPDRWLIEKRLPSSRSERDAALVELAAARRDPEGRRVIKTLQLMGTMMLQSDDATSAVNLLEPEIEHLRGETRPLNLLLGEAYGRLSRWEDAYSQLTAAAREPASSAPLLYNLAVAAARTDRISEARVALNRCLACNPAFAQALQLRKMIGD